MSSTDRIAREDLNLEGVRSVSARPTFVTPHLGTATRGRLLLITFHFPPSQAAGALRWQKLARHAYDRGWHIDVLCLDPRELRRKDESRMRDLPPGTRVFGVPTRRTWLARLGDQLWMIFRGRRSTKSRSPAASVAAPIAVARPESIGRLDIRWNLGSGRGIERLFHVVVDYANVGAWARDAHAVGRLLSRSNDYAAVITCGPPHMVHEGGRRLARWLGSAYVMDLRDPWSLWQRLPEYLASPLWLKLATHYERRCVRDASLIIANTPTALARMQEEHPGAAGRMLAVMNGFDAEEEMPLRRNRDRFLIAYAGTIYIDRDPRPLLTAAARLVQQFQLTPSEFGVEFMGETSAFNGITLDQLAVEAGIAEFVKVHASRPRVEALEFLANASLLVILPQDSDMAVPSKLFEYARYEAWILALAEKGSAIDALLRGTAADVISPRDLEALSAVLTRRYSAFRRGELPSTLAESVPQWSRAAQAAILMDALDTITAAPGSGVAGTVAASGSLTQ